MRDHEAWFAPGVNCPVPGFITDAAAAAIAFLLSVQLDEKVTGSLVEIGTYMGRTFVGLVKAARPDERVTGFDLFPPEVETGFRRAMVLLSPEEQQRAVAIRRDTGTLSAADWMKAIGAPARFIHIDGGHNRSAILSDFQLAASHLSPRAVIVLDDFMHDWYPDLTEGIFDALRSSRHIVPVAIMPRIGAPQGGGTKLICATRDGAGRYADLLSRQFADRRVGVREMLGARVLTFQGFT